MTEPRNDSVYDLPTRLFHWLFAGTFVAAFTIANVAEHSSAFPLHMLAGLMLAGLVIFRVLWGFMGTRYARFDSFVLSPARLLEYLKAVFVGGGRRWAGHNPASSWVALLMLGLATGLAITGILMANGNREAYEEVHELLANAFLAVAILHVAGVVLHSLRHRDAFAMSMVDGRKQLDPEATGSVRNRPVAALVMLGAIVTFGGYLLRAYDPASGNLAVFGTSLQLTEADGAGEQDNEDEDEDDD